MDETAKLCLLNDAFRLYGLGDLIVVGEVWSTHRSGRLGGSFAGVIIDEYEPRSRTSSSPIGNRG